MPKTAQNLEKVSQLRMTQEMYDDLNELALEDDRSMANMIRVLLDEAIYYRKLGMSKRLAKAFIARLGIQETD